MGSRGICASSLVLALACENAGSTGNADAGAAGAEVTSGDAGAAPNGGTSSSAGGARSAGADSGGLGTSSGGLGGSTPVSGGTASSGGAASPGGRTETGGSGTTSGGGDTGGGPNTGGKTATTARPEPPAALVISSNGTWSTTETWTETTREDVDVTVDTERLQKWDGFGGAFHERGCRELATPELFDEAMELLFGDDGARFTLGRLPIGASDYSIDRYTLDDTGADVEPDSTESNRPPADLELSQFSIARDRETLIPCIQGALRFNPSLRLWAVPYTPPVWMKTGYRQRSNGAAGGAAERPSYFDGGSTRSDLGTLSVYAQYFVKYIQAYEAEGIDIQAVAPQSEPTLDQNYPSCLWDAETYRSFVADHLGPALAQHAPGTKIMLAMLGNETGDPALLTATLGDPLASAFVSTVGVQWGMLARLLLGPQDYGVPVWVTEHKCGNYPFITSDRPGNPPIPAYVEPPPNDQRYGVETWWYIRDAILKAKVSAYHFPHLVLDRLGLGNDTSRSWAQNSLLVVDDGKVVKTQAYWVARHFSEFVVPGATVRSTDGGDAVAFENPDGSLVAVVYSSEARADYTVAIGGKKLAFAIPAGGWATVKYTP